jgi:hypothetical protein
VRVHDKISAAALTFKREPRLGLVDAVGTALGRRTDPSAGRSTAAERAALAAESSAACLNGLAECARGSSRGRAAAHATTEAARRRLDAVAL